jgi:hypothetical protein
MNIFVLNSGRCGSTTFIRACSHINNYSCGHETLSRLTGTARFDYPDAHIEADNRLCWLLGRLELHYGDDACYVHLQREREAVINSFIRRADSGIMQAYRDGILMQPEQRSDRQIATDYVDTVETNIQFFLRDKTKQMQVRLEHAADDFAEFWHWIKAQGELDTSIREWDVRYNASRST